ncbi:hypothetical protein GCM10010193_25960 [Kitasatospora atroaurantiaca]|uniref:Uncharacterized protein n=1 Tax=Kitasatospora atroaurantiaca TaxID=285545 RepID=A0A561F0F0_9ACTN|nr:hypothetical protein FB465_6520 [Kitasatospora atroaurantiaca]
MQVLLKTAAGAWFRRMRGRAAVEQACRVVKEEHADGRHEHALEIGAAFRRMAIHLNR